jgi:hypothetical protein
VGSVSCGNPSLRANRAREPSDVYPAVRVAAQAILQKGAAAPLKILPRPLPSFERNLRLGPHLSSIRCSIHALRGAAPPSSDLRAASSGGPKALVLGTRTGRGGPAVGLMALGLAGEGGAAPVAGRPSRPSAARARRHTAQDLAQADDASQRMDAAADRRKMGTKTEVPFEGRKGPGQNFERSWGPFFAKSPGQRL